MKLLSAIIILLTINFGLQNNNTVSMEDPQPVELGKVNWLRNFETALSKADQEQKQIFLLFQEVPGCMTCQNYGQQVLSHPLIVEAIETLFVPLAIYNNKVGADARVLKYYGEPSWNNPVVRIVNSKKETVIPRVSGNYSKLGVVQAMIQALQKNNQTIPQYLQLLEKGLQATQKGTETAIVSMYCFWTGEKELGSIDGVVETQPGFMGGREVVKVKYDPDVVSYQGLIKDAKQKGCAGHVYTNQSDNQHIAKNIVGNSGVSKSQNFRMDSEPKYYLSKTIYRYVPMTPLQAVKTNRLVGNSQSPNEVLSPRQQGLAQFIQANPSKNWKSAINEDLEVAWERVEKIKKR